MIGVVYENRPNVTSDVAGLCVRSGNAAYLRGSVHGADDQPVHRRSWHEALEKEGLPRARRRHWSRTRRTNRHRLHADDRRARLPDTAWRAEPHRRDARTRARALRPRRRRQLSHLRRRDRRPREARWPSCATPRPRDPASATPPRPCWSTRRSPRRSFRRSKPRCPRSNFAPTTRRDASSPTRRRASEEDYEREFLDLILAVKVVASLDEAIAHVARYGTGHSEAILTERRVERRRLGAPSRRGRGARQRVDPVHRRRRAGTRRRGRHLDPEAARPWPDGTKGTDLSQVGRTRRRTDSMTALDPREELALRLGLERGAPSALRLREGRARAPRRERLPERRRHRVGLLPRRPAREAGARGGSGRHRQDRARQGGRRRDRGATHPTPVLRGTRRLQGALRVELPQAVAAHPGRTARGRRAPRIGATSKRTSSARSSCSRGHCSKRSRRPIRSCC